MSRKTRLWLDSLWLLLIAAYVLLGVQEAPLHGDEATIIWMSEDFDTVFVKGEVQSLFYEAPPRRSTEQHLRILNGNFSRIAMGAMWSAAGMGVEDLNEQWVWDTELSPAWQRTNGHMPSEKLLFLSRYTSAVLTVLSAVLVFAIARLIARQLPTKNFVPFASGLLASALYISNAAVMLNGRRAMFEGGLLFTLALVAWFIFRMQSKAVHHHQLFSALGIATGLALSAKHSAAFTVSTLYAGFLIVGLWQAPSQPARTKLIGNLGHATIIAIGLMFLLTPLWWRNPLQMPSITLDERQQLLDLQVNLFGGYDNHQDRLQGIWDECIVIHPQYAEASYWFNFEGVAEEIAHYESQGVAGFTRGGVVVVSLRLLLLLAGIIASLQQIVRSTTQRRFSFALLLWWLAAMLIISYITVPLHWQRYYLPLQIPLSILMGIGGAWLLAQMKQKSHVAAA